MRPELKRSRRHARRQLPAALRSANFAATTIVLGAWLLVESSVLAAPPTLNYFYPPGLQRGQTREITASGSFANWPAEVWIDRAGLSVACAADKGKLTVTAADDAEPGVYWLRVRDAEGASSVKPLIVGTLPETDEKEPNNAPNEPQKLAESTVVNGRLEKSGDVDGYAISLAEGDVLVASLVGNAILGSPMDAVLQICDARGFILEQTDDSGGLDPRLTFTATKAGDYTVRTFAFPSTPNSTVNFAGADTFVYRLSITKGPFVDHALPLAFARNAATEVRLSGWNLAGEQATQTVEAPTEDANAVRVFSPDADGFVDLPVIDGPVLVAAEDNSLEQPQTIAPPIDVSGRLAAEQTHAFRFTATKGKKLRLKVLARTLLSPLDAVLLVFDSTGKMLQEIDDVARQRDPELVFTPPADGDYTVAVRDLHRRGGDRFVYRLSVSEVQPDFALSLAADSFVLKAGEPLEIAVTIDRRDGFSEPIEVSVDGLPDGVSAETATSESKGDSAKSVKLKLTSDKAGATGPIRIVGRTGGDTPQQRVAEFDTTDPRWRLSDAWLTVTTK
ncbi:MAG: PPC domain-containing protein [Pirellulaceae bacterium]